MGQRPVSLRDGVYVQQAVRATLIGQIGHLRQKPFARNPTVDHDMRDMDPFGSELPGQRLRQIAQRALGGAECREPRLAAQAAAGACEEEAGTMAEGLVCVLPCEQCGQSGPCEIKASQRVLAPMDLRSEEHTSELQSLKRISYA